MGNFQFLAEKILAKNNPCFNEVSSFLPLAEETGNLQGKSGNNAGNFERRHHEEGQCTSDFKEETYKETSRKPDPSSQETLAVKNNDKSFLRNDGIAGMLEGFFSSATGLNIELLSGDKQWLKLACFGTHKSKLSSLLSEYIDCWHKAMEKEPIPHKKQNVGRRAANIWLREALINLSKCK